MLTRLSHSEVRSAALEVCGGGRSRRKLVRSNASWVVAATCVIASTAALRTLAGQAPVESYYVNDGKNNNYDNAFGELAKDLGGHVPWSRYIDVTPVTGHYFARAWTNPTTSFAEMMYDGALDLNYLNSQVIANCGAGYAILPFNTTSQVFLEPGVTTVPIRGLAWWNAGSVRRQDLREKSSTGPTS